jgi:hypothetical protein
MAHCEYLQCRDRRPPAEQFPCLSIKGSPHSKLVALIVPLSFDLRYPPLSIPILGKGCADVVGAF